MSRAENTKNITINTMENKIYKSRTDKMFCGVCGGLAKYFECDSTIIRLAAALLGLCYGCGLLAYILAAIIIPKEPIAPSEVQ